MGGGDEGVEDRGVAAGAVERHFDGEHGGIGGGVLEEGNDGGETFVGVMEENVPLANGLEIGRSTREGGRQGRGEGGIAQSGLIATRLGEGENLGEIDRAGDAVGVIRKKLQMAEEEVFHFQRAIDRNLQADGGSAVSFLKFLLDGEEKILCLFLVDVEFAVAGDSDRPGPLDFHAGEDLPDEVADEFREEQELLLFRLGCGKMNQAWDAAGNLNEGVAGGLRRTGLRIEDRQVDGFIQELGKGMTGIHGEGGEDGENVPPEGFQGPGHLGFGQIPDGAKVDAGFGKGGEQGLVQQGVLVGNHLLDAFMDGEERLAGTEAVRAVGIAAVFQQLFQGGDADFKKLVEVGADNREEFEPFEKGLGRILRLLQNPLVEFQPAEFPVDVRGGGKWHHNKIA